MYNQTGKRVGREEVGYPPPRSLILFVHVLFVISFNRNFLQTALSVTKYVTDFIFLVLQNCYNVIVTPTNG